MRSKRRLTIATAVALLYAFALPGASGADPVGDALGGVGEAVGATPELPPVTVGGGGLPQVTIGGTNGGGGSPPAGGGSQPATTAPFSSAPATGTPSIGSPASGDGNESSRRTGAGTGNAGADSGARTRSKPSGSSRAASSSRPSGAEGGAAPAAPERAASSRKDENGKEPVRGRSFARRVVSHIPDGFRLLLFGVGGAAVFVGLLALYEARRSRRAHEDALSDPLTGLPNRQAFEERMAKEWARATRYDRDLGLLLLDLDGFKEVNDTHGHMVGDRLLREVAAAIAGRVRESDVAARLGGDEFVVLCPETAGSGLETLASGLEQTLAEHSVGASVGFAEREPGDLTPTELLERADNSMYNRKHVRREAAAAGTEVLVTA